MEQILFWVFILQIGCIKVHIETLESITYVFYDSVHYIVTENAYFVINILNNGILILIIGHRMYGDGYKKNILLFSYDKYLLI